MTKLKHNIGRMFSQFQMCVWPYTESAVWAVRSVPDKPSNLEKSHQRPLLILSAAMRPFERPE